MALTVTTAKTAPKKTDLVVIAVSEGENIGKRTDLPPTINAAFLAGASFRAELGQTLHLPPAEADGPSVMLLGMGASDALDVASYRKVGARLVKAATKHKVVTADLFENVPDSLSPVDAAQAFAEGAMLGSYRYDVLRSEAKKRKLDRLVVVSGDAGIRNGIAIGVRIAEAVAFARDLVNEPGGSLTPVRLAAKAQSMAKREGLKCKIYDEKAIAKMKLGGLIGVNRGSDNPARFIELTYEPPSPRYSVALVGKGITFDAGGLSIKTGTGMMSMKTDMAGAAAVLGAMAAVAAVKPRVKVTAYVPATDNMLGGDATRPGDVLTFRNGKTAEILNTDAEGRLVLADALSLASETSPDAIIDLATLTGACMVALGPKVAGVMTNHQGWADQVLEAGQVTGERLWQLPLPDDYRKMLDSNIADMKNIGGSYGGAITAGLFLREFVADDIPWVHLDIAGPSNTDSAEDHIVKGGTGFGVRLLLEALTSFRKL